MAAIQERMKKNGIEWMHRLTIFLAGALGVCLLMAGCVREFNDNLPFYEFREAEGVLIVDTIQYFENKEMVGVSGNEGRWIFSGKPGDAIGICGGKEESGGKFTIYEVLGDESRNLILALPTRFTFGPYREFLGFKEGVELGMPAPEIISHIVITCLGEDNELIELGRTSDAALTDVLLSLYNDDSAELSQPEGTYQERAMKLFHKEYPALYFYLRCSYHAESGAAYLRCADAIYRRLPPGLEALAAVPV